MGERVQGAGASRTARVGGTAEVDARRADATLPLLAQLLGLHLAGLQGAAVKSEEREHGYR
jgi:hypothetical protein